MPLPESSNTLIVDCDGVLADKSVAGNYGDAGPLTYGISQVNKLYEMGYTLYCIRHDMEIERKETFIFNTREVIRSGLTG